MSSFVDKMLAGLPLCPVCHHPHSPVSPPTHCLCHPLTLYLCHHPPPPPPPNTHTLPPHRGQATTLKRNGSDFSATILGSLFRSSYITIWTDVDGVYSADPRKVCRHGPCN
jgi:hypothetical protein